jgi:hypothetical protein
VLSKTFLFCAINLLKGIETLIAYATILLIYHSFVNILWMMEALTPEIQRKEEYDIYAHQQAQSWSPQLMNNTMS